TEAIVLLGMRSLTHITFKVNGVPIDPAKKPKFLGAWLDHRRSSHVHIYEGFKKSERFVGRLIRLMSNVSGPSLSKRKLLATVMAALSSIKVKRNLKRTTEDSASSMQWVPHNLRRSRLRHNGFLPLDLLAHDRLEDTGMGNDACSLARPINQHPERA
ncbi:hypothetical protein J6590_105297, partial [Homalodisca vitripennis]